MHLHDTLILMQTIAATATQHVPYLLTPSNVFLMFFIMLGPLKAIGPFHAATRELQPAALRAIAWKVFAYGVAAVLVAALLGSSMLRKWNISVPVMELASGLVFLLVALQLVLSQYEPPPPHDASAGVPQVMHLVFPITVTPYGIAVVIMLMALSADLSRTLVVLGTVLGVMVLNLLAMLAVRLIMRGPATVVLQVLGAVLGILQVALAIQLIVSGLSDLGVPIAK